MIRVVVIVDIDDPKQIGHWDRRIEVKAPPGYTVTKPECTGWGRDLATGSVRMGFSFKLESPPDILPRVAVYGDERDKKKSP